MNGLQWHIVTGEYPPQAGGVSDYTRLVAEALAAAGDEVTVWAPPCGGSPEPAAARVGVRRLPDTFGPRSIYLLNTEIDARSSRSRLLIQYVPHAFGWKALNVPFSLWARSRRGSAVWVMFHEVAFPISRDQPLRLNALGAVTRGMASLVAGAATRAFVSTLAWADDVRALVAPSTSVEWLPVPSAVPVCDDTMASQVIRTQISAGMPIVGHFGTYGELIRPTLVAALRMILQSTAVRVLLLGRGSDAVARELASDPSVRGRVHGPGSLNATDLSRYVGACDVMLQPYPDGVTTRRTSMMVALAHGRPVVTTRGRFTEPLWQQSSAVSLVEANEPPLLAAAVAHVLAEPQRAARMSAAACALYDTRFDIRHTVAALRADGAGGAGLRAAS
jgi:glycosyltransferase involved in cell wall biosynthesis